MTAINCCKNCNNTECCCNNKIDKDNNNNKIDNKIDNKNNNNNNNNEKLFWKVFKNKYLLNLIFNSVRNQIIYYDQKRYQISNRIKFEQIQSLEWMVANKEFKLLKDKLKSTCCFIQMNEFSIKKLISEISKLDKEKDDATLDADQDTMNELIKKENEMIEILKLLYTNKSDEMESIDLIECSMVLNSLTALKTFLEIIPKEKRLCDRELIDIGIVNSSLKCLKYIISTSTSSNISYSESELIKNALDSNEPDNMLMFIQNDLKLNLKELVEKYKDNQASHVKSLSIFFLKSIKFKNLILENNFILDKESMSTADLRYRNNSNNNNSTMVTNSSSYTSIIDPNQHSPDVMEIYSTNLEFENLKAMLLERFGFKHKREAIIESLKNVTTTEQLLELHKKKLDIQYVMYHIINDDIPKIEHFLRKEVIFNPPLLTCILKFTLMYFSHSGLDLYLKMAKISTSYDSFTGVSHLNNAAQLNYKGITRIETSVDTIVEVINRAMQSVKLKDVFILLLNVLFIKYDEKVINRVLLKCDAFRSKFDSVCRYDDEQDELLVKLIWKNPDLPLENLKILINNRIKPFPERGLSIFISKYSDFEKIKILNNICLFDSQKEKKVLTPSYRKILIEDYLQLNAKTLSKAIQIYKALDIVSIDLQPNEIASYLFNKFIIKFINFSDSSSNYYYYSGNDNRNYNGYLELNQIINLITNSSSNSKFIESTSFFEIIKTIIKLLKIKSLNQLILEKSIENDMSDESILELFKIYKENQEPILKNPIFNLLLKYKRYFIVKKLIEKFIESNGAFQYFTPSPFQLDKEYSDSLNLDKLFTNYKITSLVKSKINRQFVSCQDGFLIDIESILKLDQDNSNFISRKDLFEYMIEYSDIETFKKVYANDNSSFDQRLKYALPIVFKFNRFDILQYYFHFIEFETKSEFISIIRNSIQLNNIQIFNFLLDNTFYHEITNLTSLDYQELFKETLKYGQLNIIKLLVEKRKEKVYDNSIYQINSKNNTVPLSTTSSTELTISENELCNLLVKNRFNVIKYLFEVKILKSIAFKNFQVQDLDNNENSNLIINHSCLFFEKPPSHYQFYCNHLYPIFISNSTIKVSFKLFNLIFKIINNNNDSN